MFLFGVARGTLSAAVPVHSALTTPALRTLVAALPEYRDMLLPSILEEFQELTEEDFLSPKQQNIPEEAALLPTNCNEQVLEAAATSTS